MISNKLLLRVYFKMCPDDPRYPTENRDELAAEMRNVLTASSIEKAAKVIQWWDTFGYGPKWNKTPVTFVTEYRRRVRAEKNRKK